MYTITTNLLEMTNKKPIMNEMISNIHVPFYDDNGNKQWVL